MMLVAFLMRPHRRGLVGSLIVWIIGHPGDDMAPKGQADSILFLLLAYRGTAMVTPKDLRQQISRLSRSMAAPRFEVCQRTRRAAQGRAGRLSRRYIGRLGLASRNGVPASARRRRKGDGAQRGPYCWCQAWI